MIATDRRSQLNIGTIPSQHRRDFIFDSYLQLYLPLWHPELSGSPIVSKDFNLISCTVYGATHSPPSGRTFDGINDYIDVGNPASLQLTHPFTFEVWYKQSNLCSQRAQNEALGGKYDGTNKKGYRFFLYTSDNLYFTTWDGTNYSEPGASFTYVNQWVHIVGTHNGATARLYFNGVLVNSQSTNNGIADAACNFHIGRLEIGGAPATGFIGEVRLYSRVLNAAEILHNYNGTRGRYT